MNKYIRGFVSLIIIIIKSVFSGNRIRFHGYKFYFGRNVKIKVSKNGKCDLGEKTWISDYGVFNAEGGYIKLGYNNFFNENCKIIALKEIEIGDNNLFGPNVIVIDHNHNYDNLSIPICKQGMSLKKISIGSDVWVGSNVVVCAGVTIGSHIVIGANAVVTKDLIEPGVYAGIPAVKIK